jgi:hypothetical protein
MYVKIIKIFSNLGRKVPLFGQLLDARKSSIKSSARELIIATIFSTLPIWFFPIIISQALEGTPGILDQIFRSVERADLFIYSTALVGPLIYSITKNYIELDQTSKEGIFGKISFEFPYGMSFIVISPIICMFAAFCYGLSNLSTFDNFELIISKEFITFWSITIYLFSLFCLFAVSVYRAELENVSKSMTSDEQDFLKKWSSRND